MLNFNKKQSWMARGRTALLVVLIFLASVAHAADWDVAIANEADIRDAADVALNTRLNETDQALAREVIRSTNEDTLLNAKIDNEADIRDAADVALNTHLNETDQALAREVVRSTNEDIRLSNAIGNNQNINSLNTQINNESKRSLSAGLEAAGNAIGNMAFNNTRYISNDRDLSSAVRTLDANLNRMENHFNGQINRLENKLDKHHHEMKRGFASLAAMTRLVPNPRGCGDTQISIGVGHYHGSTGIAIGAFHYIDNNTLVNVGVGYSGHDSATFGAGLTFGF